MNGYTIIHYRPDLHDAVIGLRRDAYSDPFPEAREYLRWKYEENPWLGEYRFYLALDANSRVCGMRGAYGTRWTTPAGAVTIPCADDFSIAHEHRNTGLMSAIMRFMLADLAQRGYPYLMNTSGGRVTVLQSLASGWKSVAAMEPAGRLSTSRRLEQALHDLVRGRRLVWRLTHKSDETHSSSPRPLARLDGARVATIAHGLTVTVDSAPRPQAMASLAARAQGRAPIRHVRDETFFAWRFRNPARDYRFLFAEREGNLAGWLAIARQPACAWFRIPFLVADWDGSAAVREELLRLAIRRGRFDQLGVWTGTMPPADRAMLERAGFRPVQKDMRARGLPCVLLRKLTPGNDWTLGGAPALERSAWDVRLIDSMHA